MKNDALTVPAIGAEHMGGLFAGLTIHENEVYQLVLLPGENETCSWSDAVAWAEKQGGVLPSRIDQLVLLKNLKGEFKEAWYWSGKEYAADSDDAWTQNFDDGSQDDWLKDDKFRARAVRRVPI